MSDNKSAKKRKKSDFGTGPRMKQIRLSLNYTMAQMGAFLGVTRSGYFRMETGASFPTPWTMETLSSRLGIAMDWLLLARGPAYFAKEPAPAPAEDTSQKTETTETNKNNNSLPTDNPDILEMVTSMQDIPLLKHELLAHYQRLKIKNKALFENTDT